MAYDLAWLSQATFADLDAAMQNITTRREVEPLLRTKQGEAIARRLIETRGTAPAAPKQQYGIEWLRSATYADLKAALVDVNARPQVENLLRTVEGAKIASQLINDTRVVPPANEEPVSEEEQAQIDADNARADAEAAQAAQEPQVEETPAVPAKAVEQPKTKIVVDYQVTDEQTGKPIGRPTHVEGWTAEEVIEKLKAAHMNAVRYAERLKKRIDTFDQATRVAEQAAKAKAAADEAVAIAKKENDPSKFSEAVDKTSTAQRQKEAADRATAQYYSILIESWMDDHKEDYVPCEASSELLNAWLLANNKPVSYENLEAAFQATKHKQPVPQRRAASVSVAQETNPPAAATAPTVASVEPIAQPAAVEAVPASANPPAVPPAAALAPTPTSAKAAQSAPARRPGVNGGLQPGSTSARRPVAQQQTPQQTERSILMKEIRNMDPGQYRKLVATSEEFRNRLKAAGIVDAGVR